MAVNIGIAPQLIKPSDAAAILNVSVRTIHKWIEKGVVPYVELPGTGGKPSYRIPLRGLLDSLSGNYDLAAELDVLYAPHEPGAAPAESGAPQAEAAQPGPAATA